jgi:hypothetical protein
MSRGLQHWAAQRLERRLRREWDSYRESGRSKTGWFNSRRAGAQTFRSLIQINFYRD